jgi:hypothetical protein
MEYQGNGGQSNLPIINYGVSGLTKKIYHSNKEVEKAGYQRVETKSGGVVYHRYLDGLIGTPSYLAIQTNDYGTKLRIFLRSQEQIGSLDFDISSASFRAFVSALYHVEFGKEILVQFYAGENKQEPSRPYQNCYITYVGEKHMVDGKEKAKPTVRMDTKDCPKSRQLATGKWNHDDRDEWYYNKAQELILRFNEWKIINKPSNGNSGVLALSGGASQFEAQPADFQANDLNDDDLPF